jgi:peptide methionine sulfoxide reductase msrA/msrB
MKYKKLTPEEKRVITGKETEPPFSGKYNDAFEEGIYACKRCGKPLFYSKDKFKSGCGWPSFDAEIPGAVKRLVDADGIRTEISCADCGAHLGHVFIGEKITPKDTRYCVNSLSLNFIPESRNKRAIFAGGCFWGMEYYFKKMAGVVKTTAGYTGGDTANPTYEEVSKGKTGHAEAIEVVYDSEKVSYEKLARLFFEIHDPTQINRQGPDIGSQYRSVIFYVQDDQKRIGKKLIGMLKDKGINAVTGLEKAKTFYPAEEYHQDYYGKKGVTPACHHYTKRFNA